MKEVEGLKLENGSDNTCVGLLFSGGMHGARRAHPLPIHKDRRKRGGRGGGGPGNDLPKCDASGDQVRAGKGRVLPHSASPNDKAEQKHPSHTHHHTQANADALPYSPAQQPACHATAASVCAKQQSRNAAPPPPAAAACACLRTTPGPPSRPPRAHPCTPPPPPPPKDTMLRADAAHHHTSHLMEHTHGPQHTNNNKQQEHGSLASAGSAAAAATPSLDDRLASVALRYLSDWWGRGGAEWGAMVGNGRGGGGGPTGGAAPPVPALLQRRRPSRTEGAGGPDGEAPPLTADLVLWARVLTSGRM